MGENIYDPKQHGFQAATIGGKTSDRCKWCGYHESKHPHISVAPTLPMGVPLVTDAQVAAAKKDESQLDETDALFKELAEEDKPPALVIVEKRGKKKRKKIAAELEPTMECVVCGGPCRGH